MSFRRWLGLGALALACACDGEDAATSAGSTGDVEAPPGEKPRQEPPANVVGGFVVELPEQTLAPGEETFPCFIAPLELMGPSRVVGGGKVTVGKGMHHGNITGRPKTGEGFRACPEDDSPIAGEASDIVAGGAVLFGSTTQVEGTEWRTFPDGMGFPIGDDWEVVLRMHLLNPTSETVSVTPRYEWFTIDEASVTHLLGPFIWRLNGFEIEPHSELTVSADCVTPDGMFVVDMMPHMHKLGTEFKGSWLAGENEGDPFISSPGYNPDGLIASYEPALEIPKGGFSFGCSWNNTLDKTIVEGTGDDEMCMLFGYAYPYENSYSAFANANGACVIISLPDRPSSE